ncbi:hypothetical protein ABZZ79_03320 [Streptomyces sp. NPDC006458]|uniref:hypothetical protein n=1 Tax=Streptomyces sp. NPDC006458 TaxID=3154302 RepID=UPI0033AB582B
MSRLADFARSLQPGRDRELAADLSAQRRRAPRQSIPRTARKGQAWEDEDRARDRRGGWHRLR